MTLVEALVSTTVMVVVTAAIFDVLSPAGGAFQAQPEVSDMHQRLRVAVDQVKHDLMNAGAGSVLGSERHDQLSDGTESRELLRPRSAVRAVVRRE